MVEIRSKDNGCSIGISSEEYLILLEAFGEFLRYSHQVWDEHGGSGDWCDNMNSPEEFVGNLITQQFFKMKEEVESDPMKLLTLMAARLGGKGIDLKDKLKKMVSDEDGEDVEEQYVPAEKKGYDPMYY